MPYAPIIVQADTLAEAWQKAVVALMENGHERFVQAPDFLTSQKECPMFIYVKNPLKEPRLHPKAPVQPGQAEEYAKDVVHGTGNDENENKFDYTYYARLRHYPDSEMRADWPNITRTEEDIKNWNEKLSNDSKMKTFDQVQLAIDTLKKDPTRRSIVMSTWIVSRDSIKFGPKREKSSSPCIVMLQPQIIDDKLHMMVVMKTNDLFNAFPLNAFGIVELQKYMAEQLGVEVGSYTHFVGSMNIYKDVYDLANELRK